MSPPPRVTTLDFPLHLSKSELILNRINNINFISWTLWSQHNTITNFNPSPLPGPPQDVRITTQPKGQTVLIGDSVTFSCVASGVPTPAITWQRDGVNLPDGGQLVAIINVLFQQHISVYWRIEQDYQSEKVLSPIKLLEYHNGFPRSYSYTHEFDLMISKVERHDNGKYTCIAANPQSTATSRKVNLIVNGNKFRSVDN